MRRRKEKFQFQVCFNFKNGRKANKQLKTEIMFEKKKKSHKSWYLNVKRIKQKYLKEEKKKKGLVYCE